MCSARLNGRIQQFTGLSNAVLMMKIGQQAVAVASMVRVDVGLDKTSPTYELQDKNPAPARHSGTFAVEHLASASVC